MNNKYYFLMHKECQSFDIEKYRIKYIYDSIINCIAAPSSLFYYY